MAAAAFRGRAMQPVDVLRQSEQPRVIEGALDKIAAMPDAADTLLELLRGHAGECTLAARQAALRTLIATKTEHAVAGIFTLASSLSAAPANLADIDDGQGTDAAPEASAEGIDLYGAVRRLPMAALMRHCQCASDDQLEAVEDSGLETLGDLIRYCSDGGDESCLDRHIPALSLETGGALDRPSLQRLLSEALSLMTLTAKLPATGGGAGGRSGGQGTFDGLEGLDGGAGPGRRTVPEAWGGGEEELMEAEVDGPRPGTRSVGC